MSGNTKGYLACKNSRPPQKPFDFLLNFIISGMFDMPRFAACKPAPPSGESRQGGGCRFARRKNGRVQHDRFTPGESSQRGGCRFSHPVLGGENLHPPPWRLSPRVTGEFVATSGASKTSAAGPRGRRWNERELTKVGQRKQSEASMSGSNGSLLTKVLRRRKQPEGGAGLHPGFAG